MTQQTAMDSESGLRPDGTDDGVSNSMPQVSPIRIVMAALAFLVPIAVAIAVVFALSGRSNDRPAAPSGVVWSFVVPAGSKEKADKGMFVEDVLPEQLTISVGDTVTILNEDSAVHSFGPFTVRPGEFQKMTFTEPGYFFGVCTVGGHDTVTITVT
jgi:plastocyanin